MAKNNYDWQLSKNKENLRTKTVDELVKLYPDVGRDSLRRTQAKYFPKASKNQQIPQGEKVIDDDAERELHDQLSHAIQEYNIDPRNVQGFKVTSGYHQGYIKNADEEIEYTDKLKKRAITLQVKARDFEPAWKPIHQVALDVPAVKPQNQTKGKRAKRCVILPDTQFGYRKINGKLDPFHDLNALSVALQIVADVQPDLIVHLGDIVDLPMFGRYKQAMEYRDTVQPALNFTSHFFAKIRKTVPNARIAALEGNHDIRYENYILQNNMECYGIRKVDDTSKWPPNSIPYFLNFDALGVEYVKGYPAAKFWINDNLQCFHGHIVGPPNQTASKVVKTVDTSAIFGHIHRIEIGFDTLTKRYGGTAKQAFSPGCLCRIDGGVPSAKSGVGDDGMPISSYENWQQGLAIIDYEEGDSPFQIHSIYINTFNNYETYVEGKLYKPNLSLVEGLEKD